MIGALAAVPLFRDVRPDSPGFQPSFLYVVLCLVAPVVLGVLAATLIALVEWAVGRPKGENGGND